MAVGLDDVGELVAPEDLARLPPLPGRTIAALSTLETVHSLLDGSGLPWGPTGSVGFELATGVPTATPDSDLDLLIRVPRGAPDVLTRLMALHQKLSLARVRVDCQIETSAGAVALAELIGEQADVMLRTVDGPRLVARATLVS
jgi:phosphoribosyl-dephospho-CoA transferase